jgi:DNA-binding transcriptional MerR regulator
MRSVVKLTGLGEETVRAWERRYGAVEPARTSGSARRYSEADVARLLLLRRVSEAGYAIGSVARLSQEALEELLAKAHTPQPSSPLAGLRERYMEALRRFDAQEMQTLLAQASVAFAPRTLVLELLAPIMRAIGEGWLNQEVTIAMEHLATSQIRALVDGFTRAVPLRAHAPRIVLATSEHQHHDLGLSMAALLAAQQGVDPVLLGADVPFADLASVLEETRAELLVLGYVRDMPPEEARTVRARLRALAKTTPLWLAVAPTHALATLHREAKLLSSFEAFEQALALRFAA